MWLFWSSISSFSCTITQKLWIDWDEIFVGISYLEMIKFCIPNSRGTNVWCGGCGQSLLCCFWHLAVWSCLCVDHTQVVRRQRGFWRLTWKNWFVSVRRRRNVCRRNYVRNRRRWVRQTPASGSHRRSLTHDTHWSSDKLGWKTSWVEAGTRRLVRTDRCCDLDTMVPKSQDSRALVFILLWSRLGPQTWHHGLGLFDASINLQPVHLRIQLHTHIEGGEGEDWKGVF